ncbi:MAG: peptide-binding protein [Bdellovibrionales bacterium]
MTSLLFSLSTVFFMSTASAAIPDFAVPNNEAPKGGTFVRSIGGEPANLHPIMSTDIYASKVHDLTTDSLLDRRATDWEWTPRLAEKWEISKDGKVFTFYLRKNAVWHDGKPVTAEDVKFSFDAIFEPKYQAAHLIPHYQNIEKFEIVDTHTVKAHAKEKYFKNFDVVALLTVLPKHVYSDVEKSRKMTRTLVGSGPYKIEKFERGQKIILKRNPNWSVAQDPYFKGAYNFETLDLRFFKDENIEIERAKKGELDMVEMRAEAFVKKTTGNPWDKTIFKKKIENDAPKVMSFIGWNLRKPLFQDKNVRIALAHLLNREEINKKFMYGFSDYASGPTYVKSDFASPNVKPLLYDTKKAQDLLTQSGWSDSDKDGVLDKEINGSRVPFKFTLIYPNKDVEKYFTLYQQDLKQAGITLELKYLEWVSFVKILDEGNFDSVAMAWGGGGLEWDPKQIWHSSSSVVGGSNFINYQNPQVDKLIDEARLTLDRKKRVALLQKVYEIVASDAPYAFMFHPKYIFYAHSKRVARPGDTFRFDTGLNFWWMQK